MILTPAFSAGFFCYGDLNNNYIKVGIKNAYIYAIGENILSFSKFKLCNHVPDAAHPVSATDVIAGDIILHKDSLKLTIAGDEQIVLTLREAELLEYLCRNSDHVLKREDILLQLWGKNDYFLGRSLDVFISRLRKLLAPSKKVSIDNVYGIGYIFSVKKE